MSALRHIPRMARRMLSPVGAGPELLCQFVTARCDARCAHCFDHARRGSAHEARELSLAELEQIGARLPPMYMVLLTGGEPFLRDDLPAIALAYARGARPAVLAIPTNGGRTDAILAAVDAILAELPRGTTLSVNVSLDGHGPLHDEIRGVPGLFARACDTLSGLRARAASDRRLVTGVITVISQANAGALAHLEAFLLDELQLQSWAPFMLRGSPRDPALASPALEAYEALAQRLDLRAQRGTWRDTRGFFGARINAAKNARRRRLITATLREGRRQVPCLAGSASAVIQSDGSVSACELLDAPMGRLQDHELDLMRLWRSPAAQAARGQVRDGACACTHENSLTMSIAYDPRQWPALLMGPR